MGLSSIESGRVVRSDRALLPVDVDGMARSASSSHLEVLAKANSLSLVAIDFFLGGETAV